MARTAEGAALTQRQRAEQLRIRAAASRDLTRLWAVVDPLDLAATVDRFVTAAQPLVDTYRARSAESAADYVAAFHAAEVGGGQLPRRLADPVEPAAAVAALRGAALSGIITARRGGLAPAAAARNGLVKTLGAATKLVLDGGRETVLAMTRAA